MDRDDIGRDGYGDAAADDGTEDLKANPQVVWTEAGRERTWEFIRPEWRAMEELARFHGWRGVALAMGQSWSAEEARPFCDALERALAALPDEDTWLDKCAASFPPKQPMSAIEWWSGIRKRGLATVVLRPGGAAACGCRRGSRSRASRVTTSPDPSVAPADRVKTPSKTAIRWQPPARSERSLQNRLFHGRGTRPTTDFERSPRGAAAPS